MSTSNQITYQLGCDPIVNLVVTEDEGSIVMQLFGVDSATDIDGFFFNLNDDSVAPTLTIFPEVDDPNGDVIDFRAEPGILNQLDNGAQTSEQFDVEVQFGEFPGGNGGQVNETGFTLYLDGNRPLTLDDVDFSKMVAVVDSDNGQGVALVGGSGSSEPVTETALAIDFQFGGPDGPNVVGSPLIEDGIEVADGWFANGGSVNASGAGDGNLQLSTVAVSGGAALTFDIQAVNAQNFEATGHYADSFSVEVQIDDGSWVVLDEFVVDPTTDTFTGSNTGQTFDGVDMTSLSYSGGALDDIDSDVTFRFVADISASNEIIRLDNINVTTTTGGDGGPSQTPVVIGAEDFDDIHDPDDSDLIVRDGRWDVRNDELYTDGSNDGYLKFAQLDVDGPVEFSIDARGINLQNFEATGYYADNIKVQVQLDDGSWQTLDNFVVNDAGTALVGSRTGQEITEEGTTLDYAGGILDDAEQNVQFRIVSDISASNEAVAFDNAEFRLIEEGHAGETCEDFDAAASGDVVSDQFAGVTVSAQRAGDDANSENDAMIFDTNNVTGGDHDLSYTGQGNAIIISEDNDSNDADDNAGGGTISFDFDDVSTVTSLTILDVEEAGGSIDLYDAAGDLINSVAIPADVDNGEQTIEINTAGVGSMDVNLVGSGAVDDLCFASDDAAYCDQYDVAYDELIFPKVVEDAEEEAQTDDMADLMV